MCVQYNRQHHLTTTTKERENQNNYVKFIFDDRTEKKSEYVTKAEQFSFKKGVRCIQFSQFFFFFFFLVYVLEKKQLIKKEFLFFFFTSSPDL